MDSCRGMDSSYRTPGKVPFHRAHGNVGPGLSTAIGACPRGLSEAIVAAPRESAALLTKKSAALAGDAAIHSRQTLDVYFGDTSGHVATAMEEPTLAAKLGTTRHLSPLLRKAQRL